MRTKIISMGVIMLLSTFLQSCVVYRTNHPHPHPKKHQHRKAIIIGTGFAPTFQTADSISQTMQPAYQDGFSASDNKQ
ncbi:MAG: hypothetical protein H7X71_03520 [Chitinophagales bacterium]|nr:hypothetical protein [Chitinophagales bacterium]